MSRRLIRLLFLATMSTTSSVSKDIKMSFSHDISMNASRWSWAVVLRNRFLINFSVEKLRSHATWVTDKVRRNLYPSPIRW